MTMLRTLLLTAALVVAGAAWGGDVDAGADTAPVPVHFFNAGAMRRPVPGEWIEYRIAFPVDPLENSLRPDPALLPGVGEEGAFIDSGDGYEYFKPSFQPPSAWRVLPLRLEVREVTDEGCNVFMTFAGSSHQFFLPRDSREAEAEFYYDPPGDGDDRRVFVTLGGQELEVEMARRRGEGYWFVRQVNADLPFGVYRFATENVDLVLAGHGRGRPPAFPLEPVDSFLPPLGQLTIDNEQ